MKLSASSPHPLCSSVLRLSLGFDAGVTRRVPPARVDLPKRGERTVRVEKTGSVVFGGFFGVLDVLKRDRRVSKIRSNPSQRTKGSILSWVSAIDSAGA